MAARPTVLEIAGSPRLTAGEFEARFSRTNTPVVLRGLVAEWPALSWTRLPVSRALRVGSAESEESLSPYRFELSPESMDREIEEQTAKRRGTRPDWMLDIPSELPELLPSLPPPKVFRGRYWYHLFFGRDTRTRGHVHTFQHSLICQIHGRKRVVFFPPSDTARIYPCAPTAENPYDRSSDVDFDAPDYSRHPKARGATRLEVVLEPGDAIFVPLHWWHAAYGIGTVMSSSLFWVAGTLDHLAAYPRSRVLPGVLRWHVWPRLRRATRGLLDAGGSSSVR